MTDPVHAVHAANRRAVVDRALAAPEVVDLDQLPASVDPLERMLVRVFAVTIGAAR